MCQVQVQVQVHRSQVQVRVHRSQIQVQVQVQSQKRDSSRIRVQVLDISAIEYWVISSFVQLLCTYLVYLLSIMYFSLQPDVHALYLYDAVSIYMKLADEVINGGGDLRHGKALYRRTNKRLFQGAWHKLHSHPFWSNVSNGITVFYLFSTGWTTALTRFR